MYWLTCTCRLIFYQCTVDHIENIDSLTQASIFSPPQLVSSLLDSVAEVQHIQVSTRRAAVNSTQPKHIQVCIIPNIPQILTSMKNIYLPNKN